MMDQPTVSAGTGDVVWISELTLGACWRLVEGELVGRVAFVRGGRPVVLPVNHVTDERTIVFRTDVGSTLGSLVAREPVAFEVDAADPDAETGWSVLVTGETERVDVHARRDIAENGPQPWAPGDRDEWIRIVPSTVTGRAISRRRRSPGGTFLPYMPPG